MSIATKGNQDIICEKLKSIAFYPVLGFGLTNENTIKLNVSNTNPGLGEVDLTNTKEFTVFIESEQQGFAVGAGGYLETRHVYRRSSVFGNNEEARSLHLGVDLWAPALTKVFAPLEGKVHSFAFNDRFGDYGATIILTHNLDGLIFHTLYGHLSLASIQNLQVGQEIKQGEQFCTFGIPEENGQWPPHLHFQLIIDLQDKKGDYPGVAFQSERDFYAVNCPNPNLILKCPVLNN